MSFGSRHHEVDSMAMRLALQRLALIAPPYSLCYHQTDAIHAPSTRRPKLLSSRKRPRTSHLTRGAHPSEAQLCSITLSIHKQIQTFDRCQTNLEVDRYQQTIRTLFCMSKIGHAKRPACTRWAMWAKKCADTEDPCVSVRIAWTGHKVLLAHLCSSGLSNVFCLLAHSFFRATPTTNRHVAPFELPRKQTWSCWR